MFPPMSGEEIEFCSHSEDYQLCHLLEFMFKRNASIYNKKIMKIFVYRVTFIY